MKFTFRIPSIRFEICVAVVAMSFFQGCSQEPEARTFTDADDVENTAPIEAHDHAHAPHDGKYVVFGAEKYHGELVFDEETRDLAVYILGSDGQTPHPITEPEVTVQMDIEGGDRLTLTLLAAPDAGDPDGASSRFMVSNIPEEAHHAETVTVIATIDGEEFEGQLTQAEAAHDHSHNHADSDEEAHEHSHSDENADSE